MVNSSKVNSKKTYSRRYSYLSSCRGAGFMCSEINDEKEQLYVMPVECISSSVTKSYVWVFGMFKRQK